MSFFFELSLPKWVKLDDGSELERETWILLRQTAWSESTDFQGLHTEFIESEEAHRKGFETESFVLDSAQAPANRDWTREQDELKYHVYFASQKNAVAVQKELKKLGLKFSPVEKVPEQNWNLASEQAFKGVAIGTEWMVVPPSRKIIRLEAGAGFGTGTHETTQLCLVLYSKFKNKLTAPWDALDFGSGSGVLAIAAALDGAKTVDGVEIDDLALDNARENAKRNELSDSQIQFHLTLEGARKSSYPLIWANILRPILLEYSEKLLEKMPKGGLLILSGLVEEDLDRIRKQYSGKQGLKELAAESMNEWRGLVFQKS